MNCIFGESMKKVFLLSLICFFSTAYSERKITNISQQQKYLKSIQINTYSEQDNKQVSQNEERLYELPSAIEEDDFFVYDQKQAELGKLLFYDKILSGNRNISCASCHHGLTGSGDGLALPVGEGGSGLGMTRDTGYMKDAIHERVPRNAPPLFNLGILEITTLFYDGRLSVNTDHPSGFNSPAGDSLPSGLDNILAAQAMFPVTSATEMAGQAGENPIADQAAIGNLSGENGVWDLLAKRIQINESYVSLFKEAFDDIDSASDITYAHAANAIAAFEIMAFRADKSPFDQYLRGDLDAMSGNQIKGMNLFYGKAGCAECHSGKLLATNDFKSIGMVQIGPGKGDNLPGFSDGLDDFGRERVTGNIEDRFKFRVLTVRNALLTGPWGHSGAYDSLRDMIIHHLDVKKAVKNYDTSQAKLPYRRDLSAKDFAVINDQYSQYALVSNLDIDPVNLSEKEIDYLMDFMDAVTDKKSVDMRKDIPQKVPSGLPIFE